MCSSDLTVTGTTNGCSSSIMVSVSVISNLSLTISGTTTICSGNSTSLSVTGATNYVWTPSTGVAGGNSSSPVLSPTQTTTYIVSDQSTVCSASSDTLIITVLPSPQVIASGDTSLCGPAPIQLNASGAVSYTWTPSTYLTLTNISNPVANPVTTISYTVTGVDTNGCSSSDMVNILFPAPSEVDFRDTTIFCNESVMLFTGTSLIGTTFHWQPSYGLSDTNSVYPVASPLTNTTYTLVVQQADGCESHYTFPVNVSAANIFLPNA